ncbi:MAG: trypsin-like peptidase domain-containing protein [Pirellulaceae bacterium]|nr:trypsin-like peptidase domain-containing protein [Pirellulaceae bacterium]
MWIRGATVLVCCWLICWSICSEIQAQDNQFREVIGQAQLRLVKVSGAKAGNVDGYASGMIVSADGKVLTTQGVFLDGNQVQVILPDGRTLPATVVRRDRRLQMSLLELGVPTPNYFDLEKESTAQQGDWVAAISNAFKVADKDEPLSVMMGVVSLRTTIDAKLNQRDVAYSGPLVLIDAITSNPGAAGGVVLDGSGRVVGMIGRVIDSSDTNTRLNYAVPCSEVLKFIRGDTETTSTQLANKAVGKPLELGLKVFTLSGRSSPPYVDRLVPGGLAAQAGIQADDLIVSVAGEKVTTVSQYIAASEKLTDAEDVVIVVARKKELIRALIPAATNPTTIDANSTTDDSSNTSSGSTTEPSTVAGDASSLDALQGDFWAVSSVARAALARIRPCVVTIESFGGITATEGVIGGIRKQGEGNTTGLIISPDGLVVTSLFNFARSPRIITVILADGQRKMATILGRDLSRNLCLLQLQDVADLPTPEWVPQNQIEVGQYSVSLGVGYGDTRPAVSVGIISAVNRIGGRAIQTDANISPANYGGPLVDIEGRVFGVCVPLSPGGLSSSAGVEWYDSGIGFAISLDGMEWWIERMKAGDDIFPGIIGVTVNDNPDGAGLKVVRTVPGSAAAQVDIQKDDLILEVDGVPLTTQADLMKIVKRLTSGHKLKLKVQRGEEAREVEVSLTPHPDSQPKSLIPGLPPLEELR